MIDVSFIIVSWNAKNFLIDCLQSITDTTTISKEIFVIDNASSDGSPEAVAERFPDVILIRNPDNYGFAKANNIGIKMATGKYICLVNSDVIVLPGCIDNLLKFMEQRPNIGMVGPRILNADGSLQPSCRNLPSFFSTFCRTTALDTVFPNTRFFCGCQFKWWKHDCERKVEVLSGCFWFVKQEAINKVGGLDEDFFFYAEDIDWCKRFNDSGWDIMFYPGAGAIHLGGASSSNMPERFYVEQRKANLIYWKKHHGNVGKIFYWFMALSGELLRIVSLRISLFFSRNVDPATLGRLCRSRACIRQLLSLRMM